ncbi:MAG: helix-turn-helix domain-containing protein [Magnetococcales bacterium]|nr:helix-turn-helix domain-containing protein [Magnetococcales bacterium]
MEKYVVRLTAEERKKLSELTSKGRGPAAALRRARILLKADESGEDSGWTDAVICDALDVSLKTVSRVRKAFVEEGFDAALNRKRPQGRRFRKLDGEQEARLITLACSSPPKGRNRWTLKLLANKLIELNVSD